MCRHHPAPHQINFLIVILCKISLFLQKKKNKKNQKLKFLDSFHELEQVFSLLSSDLHKTGGETFHINWFVLVNLSSIVEFYQFTVFVFQLDWSLRYSWQVSIFGVNWKCGFSSCDLFLMCLQLTARQRIIHLVASMLLVITTNSQRP